MAKDPAFLFYTSDFLTGTMFMSNEQLGIYIRLLCAQHQHGAMIEEKAFNNLVKDDELLRSKFIKCDGGYYNERLMHEMSLRNKKSSNISSAMKEVWEKRKLESHEKTIESYKNSKSKLKKNDAKLIGIEDENEDEIVNRSKKEKEKRQKEFAEKVKIFGDGYDSEMLKAFFDYWSESSEGGKKMRFEMEKVFDIGKRLNTWANRSKNFKNGNKNNGQPNIDKAMELADKVLRGEISGNVFGGY